MAMNRTKTLLKGLLFRIVSNPKSSAVGIAAVITAIATDLGYTTIDSGVLMEILLYGFGLFKLFSRDTTSKKSFQEPSTDAEA